LIVRKEEKKETPRDEFIAKTKRNARLAYAYLDKARYLEKLDEAKKRGRYVSYKK
jgi:hypothetical protein